jgi:hypothetical protein
VRALRLPPEWVILPYFKDPKKDAMFFGLDQGLNNRAENSHLPLRKRVRTMQGLRSPESLQRFISIFSALRNLFVTPRHKRSALANHIHRIRAMAH